MPDEEERQKQLKVKVKETKRIYLKKKKSTGNIKKFFQKIYF